MINYFRQHLGAKLFLSYLAVLLVGAVVLGITTRFTTPTAFSRHLGMMEQMSDTSGGMGMTLAPGASTGVGEETGAGQGLRRGQAGGNASELYASFQELFSEALTWAALAAGAAALAVSLYLSRRVVKPVRAMTAASQRIAAGNYEERVQDRSTDELGQLANSFNLMAGQLEQVENMRRQLIGDVAHELRTPLTMIKGSMEALIDGVLPASPETFQQIHQEAERLNRLVDDLQELSRVEAGAYEMDSTPCRPGLSDQYSREATGGTIRRQGRQTHAQPALGLASTVQADNDRIIQVLTNLVDNALRYTPAGGEVTLLASRSGSQVQVTVKDTGVGIPPEHLRTSSPASTASINRARARQAAAALA